MQDNFNNFTENEVSEEPFSTQKEWVTDDFVAFVPPGFKKETYLEKTGIKKAANSAGISMLILLAVSFLGSFVYLLFGIFEDPALEQAFQILFSISTFTLPFILVYKLCGYRISSLVSFKKTEKGMALPIFFFGVAFCAFSNIASSYMDVIFESFGIDYSMGDVELPQGVFGFLLTFLAMAVVPALVEEFACRGLILGSLRKYGDGFAVITSAIVFGILHGNFEQIPFAFLVGLFLGYSVVKTNSLRVAIAVHFFNNFISVFFSFFFDDITTEIQNVIYIAFLLLSLVLGIFFLKAGKKGTELFKIESSKTDSGEKKKYLWFFTSAAIIIFISISLFEALAYLF